jgi:hypothetical protein
MTSNANSPDAYIDALSDDRKTAIRAIRQQLLDNLPDGFEEGMTYGMIGYYVPHRLYPAGYHTDPKQPLPFISLASQKNFVALYHISIHENKELLDYFVSQYPKYCKTKLDMGNSCIRFKKMNEIPYQLIGEIAKQMTPQDRIEQYERQLQASKTK